MSTLSTSILSPFRLMLSCLMNYPTSSLAVFTSYEEVKFKITDFSDTSFHIANTTGSKQSWFHQRAPPKAAPVLLILRKPSAHSHCSLPGLRSHLRALQWSFSQVFPRQSGLPWGKTDGWVMVSLCVYSLLLHIPSVCSNLLRFPCKQVPAHLQSIL